MPIPESVARAHLGIPTTSVAGERVFSKCGLVCSDGRASRSLNAACWASDVFFLIIWLVNKYEWRYDSDCLLEEASRLEQQSALVGPLLVSCLSWLLVGSVSRNDRANENDISHWDCCRMYVHIVQLFWYILWEFYSRIFSTSLYYRISANYVISAQ